MLEILQFVFSSFWIWLGTVILVAACAETVAKWVSHLGSAFRRN